jgi:hypothetical protein
MNNFPVKKIAAQRRRKVITIKNSERGENAAVVDCCSTAVCIQVFLLWPVKDS